MECRRARRASLVELRCKWSKVTVGEEGVKETSLFQQSEKQVAAVPLLAWQCCPTTVLPNERHCRSVRLRWRTRGGVNSFF